MDGNLKDRYISNFALRRISARRSIVRHPRVAQCRKRVFPLPMLSTPPTPDDQWEVTEEGVYTITINIKDMTIKAEMQN